ncbi:hypothetical protein V6N11_064383 [Hibiscus sabdariffa]|uniref:Uncharacterized protein n=1 Tax=Hibiscus sabdariffa TaxID=183260 RepID=A0ABR2PNV3_9ROSI
MVLTPTRELGIPVEDQAMMIGKGLPFKTALVVGGDPIARQLYRVPQGVELGSTLRKESMVVEVVCRYPLA